MRQTILAALVASALTGSADVASAAQAGLYTAGREWCLPGGLGTETSYYDRYDHYVTWRCAFRP
jgi:hypothetical protein